MNAQTIVKHPSFAHLTDEQRKLIYGLICSVEEEQPDRLQARNCNGNAKALTIHDTTRRVTYFEGVMFEVHDAELPVLVHHGWNEIDGTRFDITEPLHEENQVQIARYQQQTPLSEADVASVVETCRVQFAGVRYVGLEVSIDELFDDDCAFFDNESVENSGGDVALFKPSVQAEVP